MLKAVIEVKKENKTNKRGEEEKEEQKEEAAKKDQWRKIHDFNKSVEDLCCFSPVLQIFHHHN